MQEVGERAKCVEWSRHARIADAQGGNRLVGGKGRLLEAVERFSGQDTVMAEALYLEQFVVPSHG